MRKCLSLMIMEGPDEKIAMELYKDGPKALDAFSNLKGQPGDPESRATFILIDFDKDDVVHFETKELPVIKDPKKGPWGHRLGVGPIEDPKKEGDEAGS
jgi:hypothetical protein